MPASYVFTKMIRTEMNKLSKPVTLLVFLDKIEKPQNYENTLSILKTYEENSNGMLTIKEIQLGHNDDLEKKHNIKRVPTIIFVDNDGNEVIRYLSAPQGSEIQPFIQALLVSAGSPNYYERAMRENLNKVQPSIIKVLVSNSCAFCPSVVDIVLKFALASNGKIKAEIIDIEENNDIGQKYNVCSVPYIIINENKILDGMCSPNEILEAIIGKNNIK